MKDMGYINTGSIIHQNVKQSACSAATTTTTTTTATTFILPNKIQIENKHSKRIQRWAARRAYTSSMLATHFTSNTKQY